MPPAEALINAPEYTVSELAAASREPPAPEPPESTAEEVNGSGSHVELREAPAPLVNSPHS